MDPGIDVVGGIGSKEQHEVGNLLRFARAPHEVTGGHLFAMLRIVEPPCGHRGEDGTGLDRINVYAVLGVLEPCGKGQANDRMLWRRNIALVSSQAV